MQEGARDGNACVRACLQVAVDPKGRQAVAPIMHGGTSPTIQQVRWSVLASWHALRLTSLSLVGLSCGAVDAFALAEMLAAGSGAGLTSLVLVSGPDIFIFRPVYALAPPRSPTRS